MTGEIAALRERGSEVRGDGKCGETCSVAGRTAASSEGTSNGHDRRDRRSSRRRGSEICGARKCAETCSIAGRTAAGILGTNDGYDR